jgi:cytochrome b561
MGIKNTADRFGVIAIVLHWVMAILLIALVSIGLYMTDLPNNLLKLKLYGLHKEFGFLVLMLAIIRMSWRLTNISPSLATLNLFERLAARTIHWIFYILMLALPITGWMITSAADLPVSFFGLFVIPTLIEPNPERLVLFENLHTLLAYGLIAAFCLHVTAALKHHFINKDDILKRMLK